MKTMLVIDEFLSAQETAELRKIAEKADYKTVKHDGHFYDGVALLDRSPVRYDRAAWILGVHSRPSVSYFYSAPLGHATTSWIHADASVGEVATVLYLPPLFYRHRSGTMTFSHAETGLDRLPADVSPDALSLIAGDHDNPPAWISEDYIAEKPGRLVAYPSERFHARDPQFGYGSTPETMRIVLVSFFKRLQF